VPVDQVAAAAPLHECPGDLLLGIPVLTVTGRSIGRLRRFFFCTVNGTCRLTAIMTDTSGAFFQLAAQIPVFPSKIFDLLF
jgi:hypothetical protein